jgi:hypothetical protein
MSIRSLAALIVFGLVSPALAQSDQPVATESRDAAAAYIGTNNYMVGRVGRECLALLGRPESPEEFVQSWQRRNAKYFIALQKYMIKRLDRALAEGGTGARDAVASAYGSAVRREGEAIAERWYQQGGKQNGCAKALQLIDTGAMDIGPKVPIFHELQALAAWAE